MGTPPRATAPDNEGNGDETGVTGYGGVSYVCMGMAERPKPPRTNEDEVTVDVGPTEMMELTSPRVGKLQRRAYRGMQKSDRLAKDAQHKEVQIEKFKDALAALTQKRVEPGTDMPRGAREVLNWLE